MQQLRSRASAVVPDGWVVKESLELLSPDRQSYVVGSSEFVGLETSVEEYAEAHGILLNGVLPNYTEITLDLETTDGEDRLVRRFEGTASDGTAVAGMHVYYVENGRAYLTGARIPLDELSDDELGDNEERMKEMLAGIRLTRIG